MIALARAIFPAARAPFPDKRDVFFMTPDLSGQPLADLKQWLAIGAAGEDALLLRLLDQLDDVGYVIIPEFYGPEKIAEIRRGLEEVPVFLRYRLVRLQE